MTQRKSTTRLEVAALGPETLLSPHDAGRFLGLSVRSLERYRAERCGPKFVRLSGHCIRYRLKDLMDFVTACEVSTETETA